MASSGSVTSYWLAFFRETGLPEKISTKYAVMFTNERIDPSMLGELSKDILRDIGITTMGDIISILRQARATVDKETQDKALEGVARATPAGRTIAHYVGANSKRKEVIKFSGSKTSNCSTPELPLTPLRRRVTPEIEGSYKVIMPKGTTPKTRAILQAIAESKKSQNKSMVADKPSNRSVFERIALKNSSGFSPSSNSHPSAVSSTNQKKYASTSNEHTSKSIFRRLGPRSDYQSKVSNKMDDTTEYAGVLKLSAGKKRGATERSVIGISSASPEKRARKSDRIASSGVIRAEATSTTHSTKSEGIFARSGKGCASLSAKQRLGIKSSGGQPTTNLRVTIRPSSGLRSQGRVTGVKSRLGVKPGGVKVTNW